MSYFWSQNWTLFCRGPEPLGAPYWTNWMMQKKFFCLIIMSSLQQIHFFFQFGGNSKLEAHWFTEGGLEILTIFNRAKLDLEESNISDEFVRYNNKTLISISYFCQNLLQCAQKSWSKTTSRRKSLTLNWHPFVRFYKSWLTLHRISQFFPTLK